MRRFTLLRRLPGRRCQINPCVEYPVHRSLSSLPNQDIGSLPKNDGPITSYVSERIQAGKLHSDPEQLELAMKLDQLRNTLIETDAAVLPAHKLQRNMFHDSVPKGILQKVQFLVQQQYSFLRFWSQPPSPQGIYIHGKVGVGKSFLMDLFANSFDAQQQQQLLLPQRRVRRAHFHEFMLDVHDRIHQHKQQHPKSDPLPSVALSFAQEARLLCLDEFQITDIADAMILKRLWTMLWADKRIGMVVVATSNRAPEALYEGGLNRGLFLPFIGVLKTNMHVIEMSGNQDYRRREQPTTLVEEPQQSYFWPSHIPSTRQALEEVFARGGGDEPKDLYYYLPVRMNRRIRIPRSNHQCAWFDFRDLCEGPLGAADYWSVCERFSIVIVDNVPQLTAARFNEARRFVTLIDALYESKTRLVIASQVPLEALLVNFDAMVESHDGDEEFGVEGVRREEVAARLDEQMYVKGEGGSSSSAATTIIRTKDGGEVEWSATGRIGVSLAQLSAVRDVSFSFQRAESRLVEMTNGTWPNS